MPCRMDDMPPFCTLCQQYGCTCAKFDYEGALCDVLTLVEEKAPKLLKEVDKKTLERWKQHEALEDSVIRKKALSKLTARERRVLGVK